MIDEGCIEIYQSEAYRPIVNVGDISKIIGVLLKDFDRHVNQTYNVGFNEYNFTKRQIAETVQGILGGEIEYVDRGDPRSYRVSFDKLAKAITLPQPIPPQVSVRTVKRVLSVTPDISRCHNVKGFYDTRI